MATGSYDGNGVWIYGEDDPISPWSPYMNVGQSSVSSQIGTLRSVNIESVGTVTYRTGWRAPTVADGANGIYPGIQLVKRNGRVTLINGGVENSATFSLATSGQVITMDIPTASFRPLTRVSFPAMVGVTGALLTSAMITVRPNGEIVCQTTDALPSAPAGATTFIVGSCTWNV